jgi:hypothetical protein
MHSSFLDTTTACTDVQQDVRACIYIVGILLYLVVLIVSCVTVRQQFDQVIGGQSLMKPQARSE